MLKTITTIIQRTFYVDVRAVDPKDIPSYVEAFKDKTISYSKKTQQGKMLFEKSGILEIEYFLPTREQGSHIVTEVFHLPKQPKQDI